MLFSQVLNRMKNCKSFIIIAGCFVFLFFQQEAFSSPNTNLHIIDSLLESGYTQMLHSYHLEAQDTLNYLLSDMPNYDYLEQILLNTTKINNVQIKKANSTNSVYPYIKIFPIKIEILYKENNNNYNRTITINLNSSEFLPNGEVKNNFEKQYTFNDSLNEMDLNYIEDASFPISKGKREEKKLSFFDKILEPAIIVATSAITVILFFTVRSK